MRLLHPSTATVWKGTVEVSRNVPVTSRGTSLPLCHSPRPSPPRGPVTLHSQRRFRGSGRAAAPRKAGPVRGRGTHAPGARRHAGGWQAAGEHWSRYQASTARHERGRKTGAACSRQRVWGGAGKARRARRGRSSRAGHVTNRRRPRRLQRRPVQDGASGGGGGGRGGGGVVGGSGRGCCGGSGGDARGWCKMADFEELRVSGEWRAEAAGEG